MEHSLAIQLQVNNLSVSIMTSRRFRLPPLTALVAFESAARQLSFKNAAIEMNLTPSAISQHIKLLESDLGASLFKRKHRGVELTEVGERLRIALEQGLGQLSQSLQAIRHTEATRAVVVHTTTAVSSLWLTPRLSEFWKLHGSIAVNQHVADSPQESGGGHDLTIWYGSRHHDDAGTKLLFNDQLVPVCSPAYANRIQHCALPDLAQETLIYLDSATSWTSWRDWFDLHGYTGPLRDGPHVNNYSIAVQCARDDVGIVLGWRSLLAPLLHRGVLVPLNAFAVDAPGSFYISAPEQQPLRSDAQLLRDWLIASV